MVPQYQPMPREHVATGFVWVQEAPNKGILAKGEEATSFWSFHVFWNRERLELQMLVVLALNIVLIPFVLL
jgi:hypothetical protein